MAEGIFTVRHCHPGAISKFLLIAPVKYIRAMSDDVGIFSNEPRIGQQLDPVHG